MSGDSDGDEDDESMDCDRELVISGEMCTT